MSSFGPRSGTDLASLPRPSLLFGDETSFSTAAALNATASGARAVELLFEVTSIAESRAALEALHVDGATLIERVPVGAHLQALERHVLDRFAAEPPTLALDVADLGETLAAARANGVTVLVDAAPRPSAMVRFPGGYIAEIHAKVLTSMP